MSNIEEMEKLQAKSKHYLIPKEAKEGYPQASLEIFPLGLDGMGLLNSKEDMPMKEMMDNMKSLIAVSLKIDKEQVNIDVKFVEEIMESIMDLNGFDTKDMKDTGIKKFIEEKQKQVENESNK